MSDDDKPFLPRWARYVIVPGLLGPVFVLGFIFTTELAHNESRCPYQHGETRSLSPSTSVREDHRRCLWNVEDHRFSVIRDGEEHAIGSRRFSAEAFAPGHYRWEAKLGEHDEVHISVHNEGHADAAFREGTEAERNASK